MDDESLFQTAEDTNNSIKRSENIVNATNMCSGN